MISLSFLQHIVTLPFRLVIITFQYFTTGTVFDNGHINKSLKRTINCAVFQHMVSGLQLRDLKIVDNYSVNSLLSRMRQSLYANSDLPNYGQIYSTLAMDGCDSTWLTLVDNRKSTDPIILYIHGGCFAIQLKEVSVEFFSNLYRVLYRDHKKAISIVLADYSLTTANFGFPQQFKQIGYLYDKLVEEGNTNIIVVGDSAGGNLSLNLLQHLYQKPNPVWPSAVISISPWLDVTNVEYTGSFKAHAKLDVFSYEAVIYYGKEYTQYSTEYNSNPIANINSSTMDWNNVPVFKNGKCLFVFGENEVLTDQIFKFLENSRYHEKHPDRVQREYTLGCSSQKQWITTTIWTFGKQAFV